MEQIDRNRPEELMLPDQVPARADQCKRCGKEQSRHRKGGGKEAGAEAGMEAGHVQEDRAGLSGSGERICMKHIKRCLCLAGKMRVVCPSVATVGKHYA